MDNDYGNDDNDVEEVNAEDKEPTTSYSYIILILLSVGVISSIFGIIAVVLFKVMRRKELSSNKNESASTESKSIRSKSELSIKDSRATKLKPADPGHDESSESESESESESDESGKELTVSESKKIQYRE